MAPKLPLPRGWNRRVRSSVLHILDLGHYYLLEQRNFARRCTSPAIFELTKYACFNAKHAVFKRPISLDQYTP